MELGGADESPTGCSHSWDVPGHPGEEGEQGAWPVEALALTHHSRNFKECGLAHGGAAGPALNNTGTVYLFLLPKPILFLRFGQRLF